MPPLISATAQQWHDRGEWASVESMDYVTIARADALLWFLTLK